MHSTLPHRFRESTFREYEFFIAQAVNIYPDTFAVNCHILGKASTTFAARCRDSIKSYLSHQWTSTINRTKMLKIQHDLAVSDRGDGCVAIGSLQKLRHSRSTTVEPPQVASAVAPPVSTSTSPTFHLPTPETRQIIILMANLRVLASGVSFIGFTATEIAEAEEHYDVAFTRDGDKYTLL